ncbi:Cyclic nucleotide-binding domain-containing protein [Malonomonas rubra DSM 5091]|uniref:Cyclic nucleotide-binding domain-containing protein n=1 Tax=Malonomonas rubra DSM 5091 TaxID=1122189 RepID=A0A1M6J7J0_MALRU|nr:cyclic nucleotide-binding domain-containing protein [Malonomonas rubra]SHJ42656.1 Cyclic nucleotide-binding domain-containing protein [Malonomonas rubra DSM 5091]
MNPFWSNIFRGSSDQDSLAYFLGTVAIFSKLKRRELNFLENIVHVRNYKADEIVFEEGDIGSGMYAIRSGQVKIYTRDENGNEIEEAMLEAGDFFGEAALTASRPRIASARTTESCVLVGLFRSDLLDTVKKYPAISSRILLGLARVISDRLHQNTLMLNDLKRQVDRS